MLEFLHNVFPLLQKPNARKGQHISLLLLSTCTACSIFQEVQQNRKSTNCIRMPSYQEPLLQHSDNITSSLGQTPSSLSYFTPRTNILPVPLVMLLFYCFATQILSGAEKKGRAHFQGLEKRLPTPPMNFNQVNIHSSWK